MKESDKIQALIEEQEKYIATQGRLNVDVLQDNFLKTNNKNTPKKREGVEKKFQENILTVDSKGFIKSARKYGHLKNRNIFDFLLFEEFVSILTLKKEIPLLTPTEICCTCHSTNFLYPVNAEITKVNEDLFLIKVVYGRRKDFKFRYSKCGE